MGIDTVIINSTFNILMCHCRLCVVLLTKKSEAENKKFLNSYRNFVQSSPLTRNDRVKFAYIYEDAQNNIVQTLSKGDNSVEDKTQSKVFII